MVEKWFITDGAYTFKGDAKLLTLRNLLKNDERFKKFIEKIEVIEIIENVFLNYQTSRMQGLKLILAAGPNLIVEKYLKSDPNRKTLTGYKNNILDRDYANTEKFYRNSQLDLVRKFANHSDYLFISDVDEFLDVSNSKVNKILCEILKNREYKFYRLPLRQHIYDFDNLANTNFTRPFVNASDVIDGKSKIAGYRLARSEIIPTTTPMVFEYTSCLSIEGIFKKLESFAHVTQSKEVVLKSLKNNHCFNYGYLPLEFYSKINIKDDLHPNYIRDNFEILRTGIVNENYKTNRRIDYPEMFV